MTSILDVLPEGAGSPSLGPVDAGEVPFTLLGESYAVDVPEDGRQVCAWAAEGVWVRLVPWGLAEWCREEFARLLLDPVGPVDWEVCHRIVTEVSPRIYGVPWWTAVQVSASVSQAWDKWASWCVAHAFDPAEESAHRIVASGLAWLRESVSDEKEARKLESKLFTPPKTQMRKQAAKRVPGFRPEDQAASFAAAVATLGDGTG